MLASLLCPTESTWIRDNLKITCTGAIDSLGGQTIALTGQVSVRGKHVLRPQLIELLELAGATYKDDLSRKVSLLVHGDLSSQHVVNEWEQHSQKLEFVKVESKSGHHICVVTARGFSDSLSGKPAECQLWRYGQSLM
jgi:hypothetical protein